MRPHPAGFTLVEVSIALALLLTTLLAAWPVLSNARRHDQVLWDELIANETCVSLIERTAATPSLQLTPNGGRAIAAKDANCDLPGARITLFIAPADQRAALLELRVHLDWDDAATHRTRSLERSVRRRTAP